MRLSGQAAVVTGAGRGIGRAISLALAGEGASVVLGARTLRELEETAGLIEQRGGRATVVQADVRDSAQVRDLIARAREGFGRLDILVNNAGVARYEDLTQTSEEDFDNIIGVNLKGVFLCCREAVPVMVTQGSGVIINVSSGAGKQGFAGLSAYCASKFGVIGLTESLAEEGEGDGVRVYALCPGGTDTAMWHALFPAEEPDLKPEHVALKALELALPDCRVRTGSSVEVYKSFPL